MSAPLDCGASQEIDLKPLFTAAALAWFEVLGALGAFSTLASMVVPHGSMSWVYSIGVPLGGLLIVIPAFAGIAWLVGHWLPRLRAILYVVLGVPGIAAIVAAWTANVVLGLVVTLWLGFPSVALVGQWGQWLVKSRSR